MPILPILGIHIFSDSYEITDFSGVQKVTNVVKKYVKKWSIGRKKGFGCQQTDDRMRNLMVLDVFRFVILTPDT